MNRLLLVASSVALASLMTACGGSRADDILALPADASAGATVFESGCSSDSCHGADGVSGLGADLSSAVPNRSDDELLTALLEGIGSMPAQAALSDQQLADVLAYLNETFS